MLLTELPSHIADWNYGEPRLAEIIYFTRAQSTDGGTAALLIML